MKHNMFRRMWITLAAALALFVAGLTAACGPFAAAPAPIPEITINGADFSYQAPDSICAGLVRVKFTNMGKESHHAQFMRLNDGVTLEQFQAALQKGEGPALALVTQMGGAAPVGPTGSDQVVLNLTAGNYLLMCFIPSADGVPHFVKGMLKPLQVKAASGDSLSEPPTAATVKTKYLAFDMPDTLAAGKTAVKVTNDMPVPHEWNVMRLADGKSGADVFQWFAKPAGPPPFESVGGMQGLSKGVSGIAEFDFKPGRYLAVCNIRDPATGKSHAELGMVKEFTVK